MQAAFRWAGRELRKRPASLILVARFVPIGRVAVNLTAGATHYPRPRFVGLTVLSALAVGRLLGGDRDCFLASGLRTTTCSGAAIAIVCAIVLGIVVDLVISRVRGSPRVERTHSGRPPSPRTDWPGPGHVARLGHVRMATRERVPPTVMRYANGFVHSPSSGAPPAWSCQ